MEARVSVLEAHYEHIQADVKDLRDDVKGIRQEMKELSAKFDAKLAELTQRFDMKFSGVDVKFGELQKTLEAMNLSRVWDRVWMLLSMGALLGALARGFKWI